MRRLIIITDLDGTLLHPEDYNFEAARPALDLIRQWRTPLILCSSKTRAEIETYRKRLNNEDPFISENGGGIYIPADYFSIPVEGELNKGYRIISLGIKYAEIRARFVGLRGQLGIQARGFGDMATEEIASITGLPLHEAMLAQQREYEEPFVFTDGPDERLLQAIDASSLQWTQGRMFHIMGDHDKGRAVDILKMLFRREYGSVVTIGLGDSLNDIPLLQAVDSPVLVKKQDGSHDERISIPGLYRTKGIGPAGWNEAVQKLLLPE